MKGLQVIAEHTVDFDILRSPANILDLGCRGFEFTRHFDQRGDFVVPVDIDILKTDRPYLQYAVTNYDGIAGIAHSADPQATRMSRVITDNKIGVNAVTLDTLLSMTEIPYYDLIKMDVEGSEKEIIMSLKKAPAKQLSIEFHCHTGLYSQPEVALMVGVLHSLGYRTVQHELTNRHGAGFNYWDSLFIR